ncbi:MAG: hypothetical protein ACE5Z5_07050 [Candidatus Bathyarchaeia archaeon]
MATKKELVESIKNILGEELKSLGKLSKGDLTKLLGILKSPAKLLEIGLRAKKPEISKIEERLELPPLPSNIGKILENPLEGLQFLISLSESIEKEETSKST